MGRGIESPSVVADCQRNIVRWFRDQLAPAPCGGLRGGPVEQELGRGPVQQQERLAVELDVRVDREISSRVGAGSREGVGPGRVVIAASSFDLSGLSMMTAAAVAGRLQRTPPTRWLSSRRNQWS
ncbi:hypothetical protein GCM10023175_54580 [Pseudonocardia xishanensis]|uniref:Uncharacterized protein n=1 Tax=Pseudonocardia xishanensis TaxID=630995 RepID=A0ABP8RYW1_9PSEU